MKTKEKIYFTDIREIGFSYLLLDKLIYEFYRPNNKKNAKVELDYKTGKILNSENDGVLYFRNYDYFDMFDMIHLLDMENKKDIKYFSQFPKGFLPSEIDYLKKHEKEIKGK